MKKSTILKASVFCSLATLAFFVSVSVSHNHPQSKVRTETGEIQMSQAGGAAIVGTFGGNALADQPKIAPTQIVCTSASCPGGLTICCFDLFNLKSPMQCTDYGYGCLTGSSDSTQGPIVW